MNLQKQLRLIHWLMAVFFVLLFTTGLTMVNESLDVDLASSLFKFHKSIGVLVIFALTARILVLLRTLGPVRARNQWVTIAVHVLLYLMMVVVPLSGYFYSNTAGKPVLLFGLPMPVLFTENQPLKDLAGDVHGWLAYTFAAFIVAHLLTHRAYLKGVWKRIQRAT